MEFDLKAELARRGMTQRFLARAIDCEESTMSHYANGLAMTERHEKRTLEVLWPASDKHGPVQTATAPPKVVA